MRSRFRVRVDRQFAAAGVMLQVCTVAPRHGRCDTWTLTFAASP